MALQEQYEFTNDWFSANIEAWKRIFAAHGAPARVLEIGSYEGRSTVWILENLMTKGSGVVVAVNSWADIPPDDIPKGQDPRGMQLVEQRFDHNIRVAAQRHPNARVEKHKGRSPLVLSALLARGDNASFDLVYVDGSHRAPYVLTDLVLAFQLCRAEGLIFCDDYLWQQQRELTETPKLAIDAFVACFHQKVRIIPERFYQLYLHKIAD